MAIPTSGTYRLSIAYFKTSRSENGFTKYYTDDNTFSNSTDITFGDGYIIVGGVTYTYTLSESYEQILSYVNVPTIVLNVTDPSTGATYPVWITTYTLGTGENMAYSPSEDVWYFNSPNNTLTKETSNPNGSTNIFYNQTPVCFLAGTEIKTPDGFICVENILVGDKVVTLKNKHQQVNIITWVGKSRAYVKQDVTDDEAGYPVRVLKGAISENIPYKDLLITAEHCLFFEGKFIPARMLINGRSIYYDKLITSYDYYHIETEKHSVIVADGMLTKSYLDTGNRHLFQEESNNPTIVHLNHKTWEADAAVPLCVSREFVEPIYRQIENRAEELNIPVTKEALTLTIGANICIKTESGQIVYPHYIKENKVIFRLPNTTKDVWILSNSSRPCDVIGPFIDDRRYLGVLIGEITVLQNDDIIQITSHLEDAALPGWHDIETLPMRWTDGYAKLSIGCNDESKARILIIQIQNDEIYVAPDKNVNSITNVA